jgi:hypothetical protein
MSEQDESRPPHKRTNKARGLVLGIAFGLVIGSATDNMGMWLALGIAIGVALDSASRKNKDL